MSKVIYPTVRKDLKGFSFLSRVRKDPLSFFVKLSEETGSHCLYKVLNKKVLLLNDAKGIEHVFQTNADNYHKGPFYDFLKPILGQGIFLSEGALWKKQRRETAASFSGKCMKGMFPEMINACEAMIKRWDQRIEQGDNQIDLNGEVMWYTLDVVLRALFHEQREDVAADVKNSLGLLLEDAEKRVWSAINIPQKIALHLPKYKKALSFLNTMTEDLVTQRKQNKKYPDDLLSTLIDVYKDDEDGKTFLRDQVMSFLLAGHETSANGLAWTFLEMTNRPEISKRVYQEVDHVLNGEEIDMGRLNQLQYTSYVFDEALRLYPPVWTMSRQAQADDLIPLEDGSSVHIERGTTVMLCAYSVQRSTKYWENPEAFDPYRFLTENVKSRPKYSYFPFGGGARLCLGHKFAKIESVVALAMIAQKYDLSLVPGQNIEPEPIITLRPNKKIMFSLKHRNKEATHEEATEDKKVA